MRIQSRALVGPLTLLAIAGGACQPTQLGFNNTAPFASIESPEQDSVVISGDGVVEFIGQVSDAEQNPEELTLLWTSSIDGDLSSEPSDTAGRSTFVSPPLSYGDHIIELRVTDSQGEVTLDTLELTVSPGLPTVVIDSPLGGARYTVGDEVPLAGHVSDALGEVAGLQVAWSYWIDDPAESVEISTGVSDAMGDTAVVYPWFPIGSVTVELTAWDEFGGSNTAAVSFQIDDIPPDDLDQDGDGFTPRDGDCDDFDPTVRPGADDVCDGVDNDCNGVVDDGFDNDFDGWSMCGGDCNDNDPNIAPGISEICDGIDQDCNGVIDEPFDIDLDGFTTCAGDCNDARDDVNPGAPELCDGIDNNCNGEIDEEVDLDGDGQTGCDGDCDDSNAAVYLGATEICDSFDNNCNGVVDEGFDVDGDGYTPCGGDCNDANPSVNPAVVESCDGVDNNCNDQVDEGHDSDGDGHTWCGGDCNDTNPLVHPSMAELCDGADQDCDGYVDEDFDADGDGFTTCGGDCDDANPSVSPATPEVCDGLDNNCNSLVDEAFDADADGVPTCEGDCNDFDATVYPGAPEICDALDQNCDGRVNDGFEGPTEAWETSTSSPGYSLPDVQPSLVAGSAGSCSISVPTGLPWPFDRFDVSFIKGIGGTTGKFHAPDDLYDIFQVEGEFNFVEDVLSFLSFIPSLFGSLPASCRQGAISYIASNPSVNYTMTVTRDGSTVGVATGPAGSVTLIRTDIFSDADYRVLMQSNGNWSCSDTYTINFTIP